MLGGPLTREDSDDIALWANERWGTDRLGLIAVERAEDGAFLGMCGLHRQSSRPQDVEVAWRLDPRTGARATRPRPAGPGWRTGSRRSGWTGSSR